MTSLPREVAVRRPANLPTQRQPKTINGQVKHRVTAGQLLLWALLNIAVLLFAGFLLSLI